MSENLLPHAGEREAFEAWASKRYTLALTWEGDRYDSPVTAAAWDAWQAARRAPELAATPIAWRLRIGSSDQWSYTQDEADADFWGRQSGLNYEKQPLYAAAPAPN